MFSSYTKAFSLEEEDRVLLNYYYIRGDLKLILSNLEEALFLLFVSYVNMFVCSIFKERLVLTAFLS